MLFGYILELSGFGPCTVEAFDNQKIKVRFAESGLPQIFAKPHLLANSYRRVLNPGDNVKIGDEKASIIEAINPEVASDPFGEPLNYRIIFTENKLTDVVSETEFVLLSFQADDDLFKRLSRGGDGITNSLARRRLKQNVAAMTNQVGGLKALLCGRIELYPHQAFVASTVLTDPVRRYILADEVGLGKTVEASIVIHDLLINKPDARILVLAPGPLCRQWLAEIYISFGGQRFNLADLYAVTDVDLNRWNKVICSTDLLIGELKDQILSRHWDMVVIDEVHNIVSSEYLYEIIKTLTDNTRDVLLLSAVPVRQKEKELYRLLALLDADRYEESNLQQEAFIDLYNNQDLIGRRLRLLKSTLRNFQTNDDEVEITEIASRIGRVREIDLISSDPFLKKLHDEIQDLESREEAYQLGLEASRHIVDKYRLNTRIIRNRRERLIDKEQLASVERSLERLTFPPHQLEIEARQAVKRLIQSASLPEEQSEIRRIFARMIAQASVTAQSLLDFLISLNRTHPEDLNIVEIETIKIFSGFNSANWQSVQKLLFQVSKTWLNQEHIDDAIKFAELWLQGEKTNQREKQTIDWIQAKISKNEKALIFCGYPGVAENLTKNLVAKFDDTTVKPFFSEMPDDQKEDNVTEFRLNDRCLVLICDESGGEGRNFAFADHLLHYDLPWQIATLEQRIGRLDRLGRSMPVVSTTILAEDEWDSHLATVFENGLGIFTKSISGLEFELRNIQETTTQLILIDEEFDETGLTESVSNIVTQERARDGADALLDEASFQELSSNQIRIQMNSNLEYRLEDSFVNYFRRLSGNQNAVKVSQQGQHNVCTIRPDNLPVGEVIIQDRDQDGTYGSRRGTFIRSLARQDRKLNFFCWGNPLFDALNSSIEKKLTNRTYASTLTYRGLPSIGVWEIVAELVLENEDQILDLGMVTQIKSSLNPRPIRVLFDSNLKDLGQLKPTITKLLDPTTANPFFLNEGASSFKDLSPPQIMSVAEKLNFNLEDTLSKIGSTILPSVERHAKEAINDQVNQAIAASQLRLSRIENSPEYEEERIAERVFQKAITNHSLNLDSIGFLAINVES